MMLPVEKHYTTYQFSSKKLQRNANSERTIEQFSRTMVITIAMLLKVGDIL
jgi:hypothetical protein